MLAELPQRILYFLLADVRLGTMYAETWSCRLCIASRQERTCNYSPKTTIIALPHLALISTMYAVESDKGRSALQLVFG